MSSTEVPQEVRDMLASMGMRHPLDGTHAERQESLAQTHERFARVFARVGNERDATSARKAARIARQS